MAVKVAHNGIEIDGTLYPLYSGAVHYWRHERKVWALILDRVLEMGFKFVESYVPWSVHETAHGVFDFGEEDSRKDLAGFLSLCREKGLFVLLRPGPHINSELTYFGFPERIFERKELLARTAEGAPAVITVPPRFFPAPSYASPEFYEEVGGWFDAFCHVVKPFLHPCGPVVGLQADNEMSFFFRTATFDQDYSDAAISLYHDFLAKKHGTIEALSQVYARRYARFQDVMPPREFAACHILELPYYLEWQEYKEFLIYYAIKRTSDMLRERGMNNVFFFHNFPPAFPSTPQHVPGAESAVDIAGVDLYLKKTDYDGLSAAARFLSASSRLPFIPEFGSGCWLWWKPINLEDQRFANYAVFMNGIKAVNHYMLADRDRWYGAPIARDGRVRQERFDFYRELNQFLNETNFHEFKIQTDAVLLNMRDYERFEQLNYLLTPLPREVLGEMPFDWFCGSPRIDGLRDPIATRYRRQHRALRLGFSQAGYPLSLADSDVSLDTLDSFKVVVAPTFDFMSRALQKRLVMYALKGGTLVLGPRMPVLDELMRENSRFATHLYQHTGHAGEFNYNGLLLQDVDFFKNAQPFIEWEGKTIAYERSMERGLVIFLGFIFPDYTGIERAPHVAEIMRKIAVRAGLRQPFPPDDPLIETMLHAAGDGRRLLFVANPTGQDRNPGIAISPADTLKDWRTGEVFSSNKSKIQMSGYSIRVFTVEGGE